MPHTICRRLGTISALAAFLAAVGACSRASDAPSDGFVLVEKSAVRLPNDFRASGAAEYNGEVLVWSAADRLTLAIRGGRVEETLGADRLGGQFVPLAAARAGESIEIVDNRGRLITWRRDVATRISQLPFVAGDQPISAVRGKAGWTVATRSDSLLRIVEVECTARAAGLCAAWNLRPIARLHARDNLGVDVHLSSVGNDTFVAFVNKPFSCISLKGGTPRKLGEYNPDSVGPRDTAFERRPIWVALPLVGLDIVLLQTLADLRSDRRVLILRRRDGAVLSGRLIDAPIGLIGASGDNSEVYAVRSLDYEELVIYDARPATKLARPFAGFAESVHPRRRSS